MLALRGISRRFRDGERVVTALSAVSLEVPRGACVALRGESGAGKSTLLAVAATLLAPDEGEVRWDGASVSTLREAHRAAFRRDVLGAALQSPLLIEGMTARENLALIRRPVEPRALVALGVAERMDVPVDRLSGGERQRVALARALGAGASLVLLDEPSASLDDARVDALAELVKGCRARGAAVLVATHDPRMVEAIAWDATVRLRAGAVED